MKFFATTRRHTPAAELGNVREPVGTGRLQKKTFKSGVRPSRATHESATRLGDPLLYCPRSRSTALLEQLLLLSPPSHGEEARGQAMQAWSPAADRREKGWDSRRHCLED